MNNLTIGFIGLGLIGGSIAKGIRNSFKNFTIIAYNRSEKARIMAKEDGTADIVTDKIDQQFAACDYIFLCTPVEHNVLYLNQLKELIKSNCIITDVGSVKQNIHNAVEQLELSENFIGGHPMAGSEKTGYENSSIYLLENAYYALTPTKSTPTDKLNELTNIVKTLGAIPVVLDYAEHDYAVAAISHVPHLIAASLVNLVKDNDSEHETMKLLAAGGFKDITRIASSSPDMWQQICSTNKENIVNLIDKYIISLSNIRNSISHNLSQDVFELFNKSGEYRNSFSDNVCGPITKVYEVFLDIVDESGAISTVATILATNGINIKNIGIIHNREFEDGVLKIEFYDKSSVDAAIQLLQKFSYKIYLH